MAKVFGIHTFKLRPGVTEADFERFMLEAGRQIPDLPARRATLSKGIGGNTPAHIA
jgi:hypothetical protein